MAATIPTHLTRPSPMLDYEAPSIQALIKNRGWRQLDEFDRIGAAYDFVRNEVAFGYSRDDTISASQVLRDGFGQCNTKGTLLMALLRGLGVPCRLHGFTIAKSLQRGMVPEAVYGLMPDEVVHSWVELWHDGRWVKLEGFILDDALVSALQKRFATGSLCAYGAGTDCLEAPGLDWTGADTFIQATGIVQDFGLFDTPDVFFAANPQPLNLMRRWLYRYLVRHWMNLRVRAVRRGRVPEIPGGPDPAPGKFPAPKAQGSDAA